MFSELCFRCSVTDWFQMKSSSLCNIRLLGSRNVSVVVAFLWNWCAGVSVKLDWVSSVPDVRWRAIQFWLVGFCTSKTFQAAINSQALLDDRQTLTSRPDVIPSAWLGSKHQLANFDVTIRLCVESDGNLACACVGTESMFFCCWEFVVWWLVCTE